MNLVILAYFNLSKYLGDAPHRSSPPYAPVNSGLLSQLLFQISTMWSFLCILYISAVTQCYSVKLSQHNLPKVILTGQVEEFFGQTSALVKVFKVFKGDSRIEGNFVIFKNLKNCPHETRWYIHETRLFFGRSSVPGIFEYVCRIIPKSEARQFRSTLNGKF